MYPDAERERRLRTSEYEREKAGTNLEYARTLLTRLEQDALHIKIHSRRQELQADLNRKREVFEALTERLRELEDLSIDSDAEDDDDTDDTTEDLLSSIVMTPSESTNSRDESGGSGGRNDEDEDDDHDQHGWGDVGGYDDEAGDENGDRDSRPASHGQSIPDTSPDLPGGSTKVSQSVQAPTPSRPDDDNPSTSETTTTTTSQQVRSRQPAGEGSKDTAHTTQSSTRAQLFGSRTGKSAATTDLSTTATTEAILDHQRAEQDALTEDLVRMAASLKKSSQAFSTSLEQERDVLDATGRSLERNELGLEGASRRMGAIRKMSEGQGWLGRMKLYAMIFGMAVAAILLVFVMPKLRF
ncbi:uncharacterized protein B0I36DRAFT_345954 [Microdochium trichocladiopsis]|uniref:Synaptobrevin n=1 Tax=Microdochium trichocladiopsis TaxID=1682393 RepID=A0A9P9BUA3_9PEZI|nr:uncharacterized protein B0I36DRAFT_345954 [Microdochium trichocladiopsis]KAH7037902.1 hypothetical protein B0I36DRAFT_345954 [Microdochium trichocladiopsis]